MARATLLAVVYTSLSAVTAFAPPRCRSTILPPLSAISQPATTATSDSSTETTNVNFGDWIADAPDEITEWRICPVEGMIPSYVEGMLIRNGGGVWSASEGETFSHIFDGYAKIHSYRINSSKVEYQARFLEGKWYNQFIKGGKEKLPAGIGTGPVLDEHERPKTGLLRTLHAVLNSVTIFDNTPVNIWDWTPNTKGAAKKVTALTDAPPRTTIDFDTMETRASSSINSFARGSKGYELLITAHPMYDQSTPSSASSIDSYNVAVELGLDGPTVNLVKETSGGERTVISSFAADDGKVPYMHSFGLSKNYAMIVLQPLRLDVTPTRLVELGFLRSMEHVDRTRVVLVKLDSGEIVVDESIEKLFFYHSISQAEDGDDVSLRLCAYKTPDQLTGEHQFLRMEQCRRGREWRNKLHRGGKFCDIVCNAKDQSVRVDWNDRIEQGFELPITRYSRTYDGGVPQNGDQQSHPRYVYSFGAYALGSRDYDNWGLFKFDLEKDTISSYYHRDSVYLSEPAFVPDPKGSKEDDGVLLVQAYFGREQETKLLVLDATTMEVIAEAATGARAPLDFHGTWIPSTA